MGTIRDDLRQHIAEVLERVDDITDEDLRATALQGIVMTLEDLIKTIEG